jgi:hypothetical protein
MKEFRSADALKKTFMLSDRLASTGKFEESAKVLRPALPYVTSRMPPLKREAPLSAHQLSLFDQAPMLAPAKAEGEPDEFAGVLN